MAAPNIVGVTNIVASTNVANVTTVTSNVIVNAVGSNSVYKINTIMVANYSSSSVTSNVFLNRSGTPYYISGAITVPAYSTLVNSSKDSAFYIVEGDYIQASVSANNAAHLTISYEIIS